MLLGHVPESRSGDGNVSPAIGRLRLGKVGLGGVKLLHRMKYCWSVDMLITLMTASKSPKAQYVPKMERSLTGEKNIPPSDGAQRSASERMNITLIKQSHTLSVFTFQWSWLVE